MSQAKTVLETIEIPVGQLKRSPYQPRLTFNLEDIQGSIQRDGILVPLTVREKEGYYEIIDGERRIRFAKELGYKSVQCTVIDVDDEMARRMVWKVNTLRQDYTTREKAYHFKKLQEEYGMSLTEIERECDYDANTVSAHLNVFKLPENYQEMIWNGEISVSHIRELEPIFTKVEESIARATEISKLLDQVITQKLTRDELRTIVRPKIVEIEEEIRRKRIEAAQKVIEEVAPIPEVKPPETSEEFEEAAKVLMEEAKKRKTPKQIFEEKKEKARKLLLTGRGNALSKIEKAKRLGLDISEFEQRIEEIKAKIVDDPDEVLKEIKKVKKEIDKAVKDFGEKQKEAEIRENVEKEFEYEKVEEIKEELRKDEAFKAELRTELMKEMVSPSRIETLPVEIPEEEARVLRERVEKQRQKMTEWMLDPEIQKRGKLFKNWVAHGSMLDVIGSAFCPEHSEESTWKNLKWSCGLSVEEAYEMLRKKLEKGR